MSLMAGESDSDVSDGIPEMAMSAPAKVARCMSAWIGEPCSQCRAPLMTVDEMSAKLGAKRVCHKKCYNAVKALHRLADSDPALSTELRHIQRAFPEKHRVLAQTMVTDQLHSRTAAQKQECREFIYEVVAWTSSRRKKTIGLYTRRQYLAYYVWQEMLSFEEAEQKWAKDAADSKVYKEGSGDNMKIAVRKADKLVQDEGVTKKRRLQDRCEVSDFEADEKLSNIANVRQKASDPEFNRFSAPWLQGASSGRDAPIPKAPSLSSLTGCLPGSRSSAESEDSGPGSSKKARQPTKDEDAEDGDVNLLEIAGKVGTQEEQPLAKHPCEDGEEAGADDPCKDKSQDPELQLPKNIGRLSMAEFLTFKTDFKNKLLSSLGPFANNSKKRTELAELQELRSRDPDLDHDSDVASMGIEEEIAKMDKHAQTLRDAVATVSAWKFAQSRSQQAWLGMIHEAWDAKTGFEECRGGIQELVTVVRNLSVSKRKASTLQKRNAKYRQDKVATVLTNGGHPASLSRCMARAWQSEERAQEWKAESFEKTLWCTASTEWGFWKQISQCVTAHYEAIVAASVALEEKKKGAIIMKQLDCLTAEEANSMDEQLQGMQPAASFSDPGLRPWLVVSDVNACGIGFSRAPMQGMGCVIVPLSHRMVVASVSVSEVLSRGAAGDSFKAYFEQEENASVPCHVVDTRQGLYVAFGTAGVATSFPFKDGGSKVSRHLVFCLPELLVAQACESKIRKELGLCWDRSFEAHQGKPWDRVQSALKDWFEAWAVKSEPAT